MNKPVSFIIRLLRVVIVLVVAIVLAKFLISLKKEPDKKIITKAPLSVQVIIAKPQSKVMTVDAYGTLKPAKLVKISVEVPGRINYIHPSFIEGGEVKKGEILIKIDQRTYKLNRQAGLVRIKQAKTDIKKFNQDIKNLKNDIHLSRANLKLVGKEFDRIKALSENQFASKNSLDRAEQKYLQTQIQFQNLKNRLSLTDTLMEQKNSALAMAKVDFKKADLALKKTSIIAGFDGFVLNKFAEKGEYINPGQLLGSIYQKGKLDVDVNIPLEELKWIESFFKRGVAPEAKVTLANSDKIESFAWDAKVARIKAKFDETTRTLPMTIEIKEPDKKSNNVVYLKPGIFVKCSIQGDRYEDIFVIPRYLLKRDNILYTIDSDRLKMKQVKVFRKFEDYVYVDQGLSSGDKIITSPLPGAIDGMELTIKQDDN